MMEYIVHNLFSTEAGVVWLVLKWALVVLAAGFVGQFGKALASYLIRRAGEGKQKEDIRAVRQEADLPAEPRTAPVAAAGDGDAGEQERKKALKAQQKAGKKAVKAIKKLFK